MSNNPKKARIFLSPSETLSYLIHPLDSASDNMNFRKIPPPSTIVPDGLQDDVQAVGDKAQKFHDNIKSTSLKYTFEHIKDRGITGVITSILDKIEDLAFNVESNPNPNGMETESPDESVSDNDDDEENKNDAMLQTLLKNIETLKPLLNKKKTNATKKESKKVVLSRIEPRFGWEVKGYHNLKPEELRRRSSRFNAPLPEDVIKISNGVCEVRISKDNPRLRTIVNVIEMMNRMSEIKVEIKKDDDVSFELEEVKIESSNSLLYLSGLKHQFKFFAICVLVVQIAMFYLCYMEASANEVVKAAENVSLIMIRIFVAVSFSFSMTNSFTDCWLNVAMKRYYENERNRRTSNGWNYFKVFFAMPNIIVAFIVNSLILAVGILAAGFIGLRVLVMFILRAAFKLISLCRVRDMKTGGKYVFKFQLPPPHAINTYIFVPTAFILESAINAFGCIAVLVVTKQLDSPINTVANFAGLMMILEFDSIIIEFMHLPKILSLKVEKHNKLQQSKPAEYDIEQLEEEDCLLISTAPTVKQDIDRSADSKEQQVPEIGIKELKFSIFVYLVAISSVYLLI